MRALRKSSAAKVSRARMPDASRGLRQHRLEQLAPVRAAEDVFAHPLGVGDQAEDVPVRPTVDPRDAVQAAVRVRALLYQSVARRVPQADEPFVLETAQRLLVGLVAPLAVSDGQAP